MPTLFGKDDYLSYDFPEPQYLGAKYVHRGWIAKYIPGDAKSAIDAFGGSQSISFLLKQMGMKTITNDFMAFDYQIGKALIENPSETLGRDDVDILFSENSNPEYFNLMETLFSGLFLAQFKTSVESQS